MTQPEELKLLKDDHCCSIFVFVMFYHEKKVHRDKMNSRRMNRQEEEKKCRIAQPHAIADLVRSSFIIPRTYPHTCIHTAHPNAHHNG